MVPFGLDWTTTNNSYHLHVLQYFIVDITRVSRSGNLKILKIKGITKRQSGRLHNVRVKVVNIISRERK